MAHKRKHQKTSRRRIKHGVARRPSRSKARANAKPKKSTRRVPAKKAKALTRRKVTPRAKSASRRKISAGKKSTQRVRRKVAQDPRLEIAVKDMNRGASLTEAARSLNLAPKSLQSFLGQRRLARRKGKRLVIKDNRPRRVPVMTKGRIRVVTVDGYEEARVAGQHYQAAGDLVRTNDIAVIQPFKGRSVRLATGKEIPLETDPNALHRIAAMDSPPFHEIYEIVSPT
jgi:hypothetical protein